MNNDLIAGRLLRRLFCAASIAVLTIGSQASGTIAQAYPSKPVRVIVPAPPGGTLDLVARAISDELSLALGQPVIVESKPGGAGMIGVQELLTSPHDGHTVLVH